MGLFLLYRITMRSKFGLLVACAGSLIATQSAGAAPGDPEPTAAQAPPRDPQPQAAGDPRPITNEATPMATSETEPVVTSARSYDEWESANARYEKPGRFSYAWSDPTLKSEIGIGASAGGGIGGFTDHGMRDLMTSRVAGLGGLRVSIGTQIPIGLELSYLGMAGHINTIDGLPNGTLVGTTFEGVVRYNILPHNLVTPYIFAGLGWQHYGVWNVQFARSDTGLSSSDNVMSVPSGVGFMMHDRSGLSLDLRGTFRATTDSTLVVEPTGGYANLSSWEASLQIGYEL